ncbi:MAG: carotenoid 1,2-hydratase [Planctomycetota bacterium]|nr:MAG: carotenoid 1,2-hydratase [Planctomycetota bacterium]
MSRRVCLSFLLAAAFAAATPTALAQAVSTPGQEVSEPAQATSEADGFLRALPGRELRLPADHANHPRTRTEWWYFTGQLFAEDGREFGFQSTWFRRALRERLPTQAPPLAVRDVLLYHGALADVDRARTQFTERVSRDHAPWARASEERLEVVTLDASLLDPVGDGARVLLDAPVGDARLRVAIDFGTVTPLAHGEEPGLSLKGSEAGQASWYYSLPRLPLSGSLQLADGSELAVSGEAWFDHEFGSSQLGDEQVGWDWFSVALDDGSELMLYQLRHTDGSADATSSATLRRPDGSQRHLRREDFELEVLERWTSPRSRARYPAEWALRIPSEALELRVRPRFADQELSTSGSTGVVYWEGLCEFVGERAGGAVMGAGYVELVGYADSIQGAFAAPPRAVEPTQDA